MRTLYFNGVNNMDGVESIQKLGFSCRNEKSDEYLCVYKIDNSNYEYGFLRESEIHELLNGESWMTKEDISGFFKRIELDKKSFLSLDFPHKAYTLLNNFPIHDIMGKSVDPMSLQEAIEFIQDAEL